MNATLLPEILETERLVLRPWQFEDINDVLAYANDPEWARFLPVPQPYGKSDATEFIARQILTDRTVHPIWAIEHNKQVVGGINVRFLFARGLAAMGWSIARESWGQGLATEAARAIIDAAFDAHVNLNRIEATAHTENYASLRVMEKIGMSREGTLRLSRILRGEPHDEAYFAIVRREWNGARNA